MSTEIGRAQGNGGQADRPGAGSGATGTLRIFLEVCTAAVLAAMFGWAALAWRSAPDGIPVHWNLHGEVDRYGGRFEGMLALPLIALGVHLFMTFLPRIDPGRMNYANFAGAYAVVRLAVVAFIGAVYFFIQGAARGRTLEISSLLPIGLGLLFIVLGNVMGKLRPNWFVGIRTPWTMSSADSWNRTHRAGGWVLVGVGLATMGSGVLGGRVALPIAMALLLLGTAGLVVYSYLVWRADPDKVPPAGRTAA